MNLSNAITADLLIEIPKRFGNVRVWRNNRVDVMATGAGGRLRRVQAGVNGQADISGLIGPYGRRLEVEVKAGKDTQSPDQIGFQRMVEGLGGLYILARDVEGALAAIDAAIKNQ